MHILICTDQHPDSVGGAQVSIRLQQRFLERAGHTVTIVAPRKLDVPGHDSTVIALPAWPLTRAKDYGLAGAGRRTLRLVREELRGRQRVDLVHVQGDFWGAILGYRLARTLRVPVVHTMHNNLDVGTRAVTAAAPLLFAGLRLVRRATLGRVPLSRRSRQAGGAWAYLAGLAALSHTVIAPTEFFADELRRHGVGSTVRVVATGVDDDIIDEIRADPPQLSAPCDAVQFVWCGRMSPEKRLRQLLDALPGLPVAVHMTLVGEGIEYRAMREHVRRLGIEDRVTFTGLLSHRDTLRTIAGADVLVQSSVGFETQGMTPYEATALGVPTLFCDARIANELGVTPAWVCPDESVEALRATLETVAVEVSRLPLAGESLRVSEVGRDAVRQSERTREMVTLYERVLEAPHH